MPDPMPDPTDVTQTYAAAATSFADLLDLVPADAYDGPGLGEWDLRSLVGHAARALVTVRTYLDRPAAEATIGSAEDYFAAGVGVATDPASVLERGRQAGLALGEEPAAHVRALAAEVVAELARRDPGYVLETIAGAMRLDDYLPTRTFELVVHGFDIGRAAGLSPAYPQQVLAESAALAARVAVRTGRGADVLLALTGRLPLPSGFSVV
jgi:hypothetical protein